MHRLGCGDEYRDCEIGVKYFFRFNASCNTLSMRVHLWSQERGGDAHEGNIDPYAQTPHCTAGITTGRAVGIPTW
jgi:hypothetical protein